MKYMLVIKFPQDAMDFDSMVDLEDLLEDSLVQIADVDGHDVGAGEINYFILTDQPERTFKQAKVIIENKLSSEFCVAYRDKKGDKYQILWPENLKEFKVK